MAFTERSAVSWRPLRQQAWHSALVTLATLSMCSRGAAGEATSSLEMQWATPLFVYNVDPKTHEDLRLDIFKAVQDMRAADPVGQVKSNRGGWRSRSDLHKMSNAPPVIADVKKQINAAVQGFWKKGLEKTPHAKGKNQQPKLKLDAMWINLLGLGDSNIVHKHSGTLISGVYYVNVPKMPDAAGSAAGAIKFRDPRPMTSVYDDMEWLGMGAEVQVNPKGGLMLLWPSWLEHYVEPIVPSAGEDRRAWNDATKEPIPGVLGHLDSSPPESLRIVVPFNVGMK